MESNPVLLVKVLVVVVVNGQMEMADDARVAKEVWLLVWELQGEAKRTEGEAPPSKLLEASAAQLGS